MGPIYVIYISIHTHIHVCTNWRHVRPLFLFQTCRGAVAQMPLANEDSPTQSWKRTCFSTVGPGQPETLRIYLHGFSGHTVLWCPMVFFTIVAFWTCSCSTKVVDLGTHYICGLRLWTTFRLLKNLLFLLLWHSVWVCQAFIKIAVLFGVRDMDGWSFLFYWNLIRWYRTMTIIFHKHLAVIPWNCKQYIALGLRFCSSECVGVHFHPNKLDVDSQ
jgi:hypothetical protein